MHRLGAIVEIIALALAASLAIVCEAQEQSVRRILTRMVPALRVRARRPALRQIFPARLPVCRPLLPPYPRRFPPRFCRAPMSVEEAPMAVGLATRWVLTTLEAGEG